ncbi:predicted protein [Streptomyces iranensis]|uniref:Uncharacterized protein n=1 Tax=Streptomyces iranensis TaxID=576784 RepID=A0A060ZV84_9ACTN|nr:predicted protein [Streptomyces iranensis]
MSVRRSPPTVSASAMTGADADPGPNSSRRTATSSTRGSRRISSVL